MNTDILKTKVKPIIEYILVALIILNTRTVFAHFTNINLHFNVLTLFILIILVGINLIDKKPLNLIKENVKYIVPYYIFILVFILFGSLHDKNFFTTFVIILPLLFMLFTIDKENPKKILRKFVQIVCVLSIISIFYFAFGSLLKIIPPLNKVMVSWGGDRLINNYYFLHFDTQNINIFGFSLARNSGIFTEAPMFSLILTISVIIESLLKKDKNIKILALLFITTLTTISAMGIIIDLLLIVTYILAKIIESKNKVYKILGVVFIILLIVIAIFAFAQKKDSMSFRIRIDDYRASVLAWKDHILFGNGYHNTDSIVNYMSNFRSDNTGISNSILVILAECGIYMAIFYVAPLVILLYRSIKEKEWKHIVALISLLIIMFTATFQYTLLMMLIISIEYACVLNKEEKYDL